MYARYAMYATYTLPPEALLLPRALIERIIDHARTCWPNECCGLLAGVRPGRVTQCYPLTNTAASPVEFLGDAREQFAALRAMRASGTELLAVYHSHPTTPPTPSRTDLERSLGEQVACLIVALGGRPDQREPTVRCWRLATHGYGPWPWSILSDG
jgi:proteasome lid subunit RPN8/RPN11